MKVTINQITKSISSIHKHMARLLGYVSKVLVFVIALIAGYSILDGVLEQNLIVQPLTVPADYKSRGMTGELLSWHLSENIALLRRSAWNLTNLNVVDMDRLPITNDVVAFGVSLNSIKSLLRKLLGVKDHSVHGNLYKTGNQLKLQVAISQNSSIGLSVNIDEFANEYAAYQHLIKLAATSLLKTIEPFSLVGYYWSEGKHKKSIDVIKHIIKHQAEEIDSAYLVWGEILYKQGRHQQALGKFSEALKHNPNMALAYNAKGSAYLAMGKYDHAKSAFKHAIELKPNLWEAWYQWGQLLALQNKQPEAIEKFKRAISISPERTDAYNEISYALMAAQRTDEAMQFILIAIQKSPSDGFLHATAAEHLWNSGNAQSAYEFLQQAQKLGFDPNPYRDSEPYQSFLQPH